ncbi:MAG: ABC transporter ATP-binding protein [Candidatus Hodarchaeota archaeon]
MISISNLSKSFDTRKVLDNVSLEIGQEIFGILGPNGAGKTTLVNIVCGLLKYDAGEIRVAGLDPRKHPGLVRQKIGLVPQETALYEYLTARENLSFHAKFYGVPRGKRRQKIKEALELAQLEERADDRVSTFSGGMKRRLALVRSLLHDPEILVLDEPSLGIDVQNRNEIWNRILALKESYNKVVLLTSNYMDEADRLSDRCAIFDQGKIVALDTPSKLKLSHAGGTRLEALVKKPDPKHMHDLQSHLQQISPETRFSQSDEDGDYYIVMPATTNVNQLLPEVAKAFQEFPMINLRDLRVREPTLDDVFLELTGSKLRD